MTRVEREKEGQDEREMMWGRGGRGILALRRAVVQRPSLFRLKAGPGERDGVEQQEEGGEQQEQQDECGAGWSEGRSPWRGRRGEGGAWQPGAKGACLPG